MKTGLGFSGAAKGRGNRAFAPPPHLRQALGRDCTHQADKGEMIIYNYRVDKIQILLGY